MLSMPTCDLNLFSTMLSLSFSCTTQRDPMLGEGNHVHSISSTAQVGLFLLPILVSALIIFTYLWDIFFIFLCTCSVVCVWVAKALYMSSQ